MRHLTTAIALLLVLTAGLTAHDNWCGYDYTQLGVPDSTGNPARTELTDINARGVSVGLRGSTAGFLLKGALFEEVVQVPGYANTSPRSINDRGDVAGSTSNPGNRVGFVRDRAGNYRTIAVPVPTAVFTRVAGINNNGVIVGDYLAQEAGFRFRNHGFVWDGDNFATLDAPFDHSTVFRGINASGQIVGYNEDSFAELATAFSYADGVFTPFRLPNQLFTQFIDVNDRGQIVGSYGACPRGFPCPVHSFVIEPTGELIPIDAPFPGVTATVAEGINNKGDVVGSATADFLRTYAFLARPRKCDGRASAPSASVE